MGNTSAYTRESLLEYLEHAEARNAWWERADRVGRQELIDAGYTIVRHTDEIDGGPIVFTDVTTGDVVGRQDLRDFLSGLPIEDARDQRWVNEDAIDRIYADAHPEDPMPEHDDDSPWDRSIADIADDDEALNTLLAIVRGGQVQTDREGAQQ